MSERYQRDDRVGSGILAHFYRGRDAKNNRDVTICELPQEVTDDEDLLADFKRDVHRWLQIANHAFVVTVYDVEVEQGPHWLIMEPIADTTLRNHVKDGPLQLQEATRILEQLLQGLGAIHQANLVHRAIQPENVLLCDGVYKIFPKAWRDRTPTQTYGATETVLAKTFGPSADVYSLGLVAYEMLLGGDTFQEISHQFIKRTLGGDDGSDGGSLWFKWHGSADDLPPPHRFNPKIPNGLSRLVHDMVRKNNQHRTQTCDEALGQLRGLDRSSWPVQISAAETRLDGMGEADPETEDSQPSRILKKWWFWAAAAVSTLITAFLLVAGISRGQFQKYTIHATQPGIEIFYNEKKLFEIPNEEARQAGKLYTVISAKPGTELIFRKAGFEDKRIEVDDDAFREPITLEVNSAHRAEALSKLEDRDYGAAMEALAEIYSLTPEDTEVALGLAIAHYHLGNYSESTSLLKEVGEGSKVDLYRGLNELSRSRLESAIPHLERALEAGEKDAGFYLAYTYYARGDYQAGQKLLEAFIASGSASEKLLEQAQKLLANLQTAAAQPEPPSGVAQSITVGGFQRPPIKLADLHGKVVVLHFWASWSLPSQHEIPSLLRFFQQEYPQLRSRGLELVTVSHDPSLRDLQTFLSDTAESLPPEFPVYLDPSWRLSAALGLERPALPQTVVLGRDGAELLKRVGDLNWQKQELLDYFHSFL